MRMLKVAVAGWLMLLVACASTSRPNRESPPAQSEGVAPASTPAVAVKPVAEPAPEVLTAAESLPTSAPEERVAPASMAPAAPALAPKPAASPKPPVREAGPIAAVKSAPKPTSAAPVAGVSPGKTGEVAGTLGIKGMVDLVAGSGQGLANDEMTQVVVYFVADSPSVPVKPGRYHIYTHNKQFEPESMVIPLGSTISFPNQDEILHNVFSVTPKSSFDLGIYGEGKSAEYTFKKTGLVLINCNVHHAMQANVLVIDTPFMVSPDADGRFALDKLPAGSGKLMIWHPRANLQALPITLPATAPVSLRLVLTKPRFVEHMNKERKPY